MGMAFGYIIGIAAAIWVIYDVVVKQKGMKGLHKILWIVLAIVFSLITAIVYFFVVKKGKF